MVVTDNVPQQVRMHPRHPDPCGGGQVLEPSGSGVSVHADAECVVQDRAVVTVADRSVDGSADRWWQRHEDDLATLAPDPRDAVAVLLVEVGNAGLARFEDPQPRVDQGGRRERSRWDWSIVGRW
jgi:hypothetical protein